MTTLDTVALGIQAGAACFGAGVLWTMQLLNYPLLQLVGADQVPAYETAHNRRFAIVVVPPLVVTLVTTVILLVTGWLAVAVTDLVLLAAIIVVTVRYGAPAHTHLARRFDAAVHRRLVATNWIRTIAWTVLGALGVVALCQAR
jgi:hypothetical protein